MTKTLPPTLKAIMFMVCGMFFFALGDMFLKQAGETMSFGLITVILGVGMSCIFCPLVLVNKEPVFSRHYLQPALGMRCAGEAIGIVGILWALKYTPLSTVTALIQILPLLLTLMGAVFLGERVGFRRIAAMTAGLLGVLVIIRPGTSDFDSFASLTLIGVLGMAIRDFGSRIAPASISTSVLSLYGAFAIILTGLGMMVFETGWSWPHSDAVFACLALIFAAALGTFTVSTAMRLADIGIISPFRFTRVIFGVGIGIIVFDEVIDLATATGTMIVVTAGIYSWLRERKLASIKKVQADIE